jgi:hypothetical protein
MFLAGAFLLLLSMTPTAQAQQGAREAAAQGEGTGTYVPRRRQRGVDGYPLTLNWIWGPAKMPPAPTDFGPHFDFPPDPLNGAPLHDPYPH